MRRSLQALHKRLDALNPRERLAVWLGGTVVVWLLIYAMALEPLLAQRARLQRQMATQSALQTAMETQRLDAQRQLASSPDESLRQRLGEARAELARVDAQLDGLQRELLKPERMAGVLQELLGSGNGLKLLSLKNLPPTVLAAEESADRVQRKPGQVYRHGVEIVVEGSYAALVAYLQRLERQPWHLYWGKTVLTADYPKSVLTVTLYTLSLDEVWLTV